MRHGFYVLNHAPPDKSPAVLFEEIAEQTLAAQRMNFNLLTTGQHYVSDYTYLQPVPLLSRLSGVAESMTVGPCVLLLPLQHPIQIAEDIATLSGLADDVILGVGAGYRDVEFRNFSVPKAERSERLEEGVKAIKQLWSDKPAAFDGDHISLDDVTSETRPDNPVPIWVAGHSQPAVARAARIGDRWLVGPHSTLSETTELATSTYHPIREMRDADPSLSIIRETVVAPTSREAERLAKKYLMPRYAKYVDWGQNEAMADESELRQPFNRLSTDRFLVGTPTEICAELERYEEEINIDHVLFRVQWPGLSHERAIESLQLLGDEVVPFV